jgi:hypothetical protein
MGVSGKGNISMVLSHVGGEGLRAPAEDGVVCVDDAVFVAEQCTFAQIGLDARPVLGFRV